MPDRARSQGKNDIKVTIWDVKQSRAERVSARSVWMLRNAHLPHFFLDTSNQQVAANQKRLDGSLTSSWASQREFTKTTNGKPFLTMRCRQCIELITSNALILIKPTSRDNYRSSDITTTSRRSSRKRRTTTTTKYCV